MSELLQKASLSDSNRVQTLITEPSSSIPLAHLFDEVFLLSFSDEYKIHQQKGSFHYKIPLTCTTLSLKNEP